MVGRLSTNKKIIWWILAIIVFFLLQFTGKVVNLFTDYLWFKELLLMPVFLKSLVSKVGVGLTVGVATWFILYLNVFIARKISLKSQQFTGILDLKMIQIFNTVPMMLNWLVLIGCLVLAFLIGSWASNYWEVYLKFVHAVPFNIKDPLFGKDISFYVFHLPFYKFIYQSVAVTIFFSIVGSILVYFFSQNCVFDGKKLLLAKKARIHLTILTGILLASFAFVFQFFMYSTINTPGSIVNGAGYAQIKTIIPLYGIMRFICIVSAILLWISATKKDYKLVIISLLLLVISVSCGSIANQAVQKFIVGPDELNKESKYISWSISNTRQAFGIDKIESKHFVPTSDLNAATLEQNTLTLNNIRLWDQAPLLKTYSQLQEIRTYYDFLDVDNDRYFIDGQYRQVMLSPRELVPSSLPSRIWINEHLTYTHGYGLCLGPVNSVTTEGLPEFFIKNLPPVSSIKTSVTKPQIYYGESDAGYAIVKTGAKEFDYPSGNDNVYTTYDGNGGIPMQTIFHKLLFALKFKELKILLRSDISSVSRILYERDIMKRIQHAIPFLRYDADPYMVITEDGRLKWFIDGYTVTNAYPYSAHVKGIGNYIRNSVKVIIDAYDGTVELYIIDNTDPIIKTYERMFPTIFKPISSMSQDLYSHIRYPQTLFTIQARMYAVYHMTDPQVFYNKEDVWRIPNSYTDNQDGPMNPYYTIMKLSEVGKKEEFILMVPFCPSKKENMIAWMAARCDQPNYGSLLVFDFPKQKLVYGPSQIESRINQDPEISKQLTLWNQGGSRVIRGSLLVIPVDQSLLYVQPLYLSSETGGVPELKRVVVAFENRIAMEPTLEKSLYQIFGTMSNSDLNNTPLQQNTLQQSDNASSTLGSTNSLKELIAEANKQFSRAEQELKQGNWSGYGEAMKQVERLLTDMTKVKE